MDGASALYDLIIGVGRFVRSDGGAGIASWILVVVFSVSGASKIRRPLPAAVAMADFGVVRTVRESLGVALGVAETFVAAGLASGVARSAALAVAAALLVIFVFLIARSLAAGERFSCACFGGSTAPLSWLTLLRTASLSVMAVGAAAVAGDAAAVSVDESLLHATAAAAVVGTVALGSEVRTLLSENRDPYRVGTAA